MKSIPNPQILTLSLSHTRWHTLRRGYTGRKLQENIECEIMHVIVEEARESYKEGVVRILKSDTVEDQDRNLDVILSLLNSECPPSDGARSSPEKRQRT